MKWIPIFLICTGQLLLLSDALRLTEVRIPNHVLRTAAIQLECHFNLEGDRLYSVKWYKDSYEFYRYVPRDTPPITTFNRTGVNVDLLNSTESLVVLNDVDFATSGIYRCEVSAEAPSFQTVSDHGEIIVVALPADGPKIKGGRPRYQLGDTVRVNCTSGGFSRPPTKLTWYINGEPANVAYLREYDPIVNARGLVLTRLGLEFTARQRHFQKGDLKLKCLATIATIYWRSNEESAANDRQQHQAPIPIPWEERATTAVLPSGASAGGGFGNSVAVNSISFGMALLVVRLINLIVDLR